MKKILALSIAAALVSPLAANAATNVVNWTNWSSSSQGLTSQAGSAISVTYTGETIGVDYNAYIYDRPSSFTSAEVSNTPGTNGTLLMRGGGATRINTFHFSRPVTNPYMNVFSVGQNSVPVAFNFQNNATFTILAQGAGHWGGGSLTQVSPSSFVGREGNGLLRFNGTFTDISFITPNYENYYGATVGVAAVPEPETYGMMLAGLGAMALIARRRKQQA